MNYVEAYTVAYMTTMYLKRPVTIHASVDDREFYISTSTDKTLDEEFLKNISSYPDSEDIKNKLFHADWEVEEADKILEEVKRDKQELDALKRRFTYVFRDVSFDTGYKFMVMASKYFKRPVSMTSVDVKYHVEVGKEPWVPELHLFDPHGRLILQYSAEKDSLITADFWEDKQYYAKAARYFVDGRLDMREEVIEKHDSLKRLIKILSK